MQNSMLNKNETVILDIVMKIYNTKDELLTKTLDDSIICLTLA